MFTPEQTKEIQEIFRELKVASFLAPAAIGAGLGGAGGYALSPAYTSADETPEEARRRKMRAAAMGATLGGAAGAAVPFGLNLLGRKTMGEAPPPPTFGQRVGRFFSDIPGSVATSPLTYGALGAYAPLYALGLSKNYQGQKARMALEGQFPGWFRKAQEIPALRNVVPSTAEELMNVPAHKARNLLTSMQRHRAISESANIDDIVRQVDRARRFGTIVPDMYKNDWIYRAGTKLRPRLSVFDTVKGREGLPSLLKWRNYLTRAGASEVPALAGRTLGSRLGRMAFRGGPRRRLAMLAAMVAAGGASYNKADSIRNWVSGLFNGNNA